MLTDIINFLQIPEFLHFFIPFAGVGGGIEAKEQVELMPLIKHTLIFLGAIATIFGLGLALAAKKFFVTVHPKVEQVKEVLAHAHCGACGFVDCEQYAEAVVNNPMVPPNLCVPAGTKGAETIALLTGKIPLARESICARVLCRGGWSKSEKKFIYEGVHDCRAVILTGGDKACRYGCLGYGTCSRVCPFGAITMTDDRLPLIDMHTCTGCRKCETACPTKVIEVLPASRQVLVTCRSKDKGPDTKRTCRVGCIACGICVKVCPFDAPAVQSNLSRIDPNKCTVCGLCVRKCPTGAITDFITNRSKAFVHNNCTGCQICTKVCPVDAASGEPNVIHRIDQSRCIGCGICAAQCPVQAIGGTFNATGIFLSEAIDQEKAA